MPDEGTEKQTGCEAVVAAADYPVFVLTARDEHEMSGCLVGFTTQVSIDPVRFLVCVSKKNHTFGVTERAKRLALHLLRSEDEALAALFGGETEDEIDKFARCEWRPGPDGVPILTAAAGWFSGTVLERHDFGDHVGMVLAPDSGSGPGDGTEVLRFAMVADLEPGHEA